MTERTYSYTEVEAAMCAWEFIDQPSPLKELPTDLKMAAWRDYNGTFAMRNTCIRLAPWIERVWVGCNAQHHHLMIFDWEFVPYLLGLVTWPNDGTWPTHPSAEFAAKLVKFRFGNSILRG